MRKSGRVQYLSSALNPGFINLLCPQSLKNTNFLRKLIFFVTFFIALLLFVLGNNYELTTRRWLHVKLNPTTHIYCLKKYVYFLRKSDLVSNLGNNLSPTHTEMKMFLLPILPSVSLNGSGKENVKFQFDLEH